MLALCGQWYFFSWTVFLFVCFVFLQAISIDFVSFIWSVFMEKGINPGISQSSKQNSLELQNGRPSLNLELRIRVRWKSSLSCVVTTDLVLAKALLSSKAACPKRNPFVNTVKCWPMSWWTVLTYDILKNYCWM